MQNCPKCQSNNYKKNGRTKLGHQKYKCADCLKIWSDSPNKRGRPKKGDRPMTAAERAREYRKRKQQEK